MGLDQGGAGLLQSTTSEQSPGVQFEWSVGSGGLEEWQEEETNGACLGTSNALVHRITLPHEQNRTHAPHVPPVVANPTGTVCFLLFKLLTSLIEMNKNGL